MAMIATSSLVVRLQEKVDAYTKQYGKPPRGICVGPAIYLQLLLHEVSGPYTLVECTPTPLEVEFAGIPIQFDDIGGDCRLYS